MIRDAVGRRRIAPWLLLAFLIGGGGTQLTEVWWDRLQPKPLVVRDVRAYQLPDHGYALRIDMFIPPAKGCLRISQHIIYRQTAAGEQEEFIPVASGLGSPTFPGLTPSTITWLKIHPYTASGHWIYMMRMAYICNYFPGLTRVTTATSQGYAISLDTSVPLAEGWIPQPTPQRVVPPSAATKD